MEQDLIKTIVVYLVLTLIGMLIFREFVCWYFKFNKMVSLLTDILKFLENQSDVSQSKNAESEKLSATAAPDLSEFEKPIYDYYLQIKRKYSSHLSFEGMVIKIMEDKDLKDEEIVRKVLISAGEKPTEPKEHIIV